MAYTRKTYDVFVVEQYAGQEWSVVSCSENRKEAKITIKEYRENMPEYPVRIKKIRERYTDEN